ncbi:MAG: hypothetical protein IPJ65_01110 [Archangiaceae bacterium]|nr:hypothetical protein [Archangiaceae bacterium]
MVRLVTPLLCVLLCSCSAALRRGNALYEQGDFLGAAAAYDEAYTEDPRDGEAAARRDEARTQALSMLLVRAGESIQGSRFTDASVALGEAFALADAWSRPGTGQAELELLQQREVADFRASLEKKGPLAAEPERKRALEPLQHPRFEALRVELSQAWASAAGARCDAALARAGGSFLGALTAAYCRALGRTEVKESARPPPLFSLSPKVESFVRGGTAMWPVTLTDAFGSSPWASKQGTETASVSVSGQVEAFVSWQTVKRTAQWVVQVPYQSTQWVQVPYTTYEYYSYPCGRTTCTGSRPVTRYRSEPRSVTSYKSEPRTRDYDANEARNELSAQVNMFVDLRPLAKPLGVVLRDEQVETGATHAAVPEAKLGAETARVSSSAQWDERTRKAARAKLASALAEHWRDTFCTAPLQDAEAAARCAWGGSASPQVVARLSELYADDLASLLGAPRFGP